MIFFTFSGKSLKGTSMLKPYFLDTASTCLVIIFPISIIDQPETLIAPWRSESVSSLTTRVGSTSCFMPSPKHSGQAPNGELKENILGVSSGIVISQSGQAYLVEYKVSTPSISISTMPSPTFIACSTESVSLRSISSFTTKRSTMIEMLCLICLSSLMSSSRSLTSPSIFARTKPCFL